MFGIIHDERVKWTETFYHKELETLLIKDIYYIAPQILGLILPS